MVTLEMVEMSIVEEVTDIKAWFKENSKYLFCFRHKKSTNPANCRISTLLVRDQGLEPWTP